VIVLASSVFQINASHIKDVRCVTNSKHGLAAAHASETVLVSKSSKVGKVNEILEPLHAEHSSTTTHGRSSSISLPLPYLEPHFPASTVSLPVTLTSSQVSTQHTMTKGELQASGLT
jgi:hypothetical protein